MFAQGRRSGMDRAADRVRGRALREGNGPLGWVTEDRRGRGRHGEKRSWREHESVRMKRKRLAGGREDT
jgi:hypothetical protein